VKFVTLPLGQQEALRCTKTENKISSLLQMKLDTASFFRVRETPHPTSPSAGGGCFSVRAFGR